MSVRSSRYVYAGVAVVALTLLAARVLGGERGLGWATLLLAGAILIAGVSWVHCARTHRETPSWSPVFMGATLACLALTYVSPSELEVPLLGLAAAAVVGVWVTTKRETRRDEALLKDLQREAAEHTPDQPK